MKYPEVGIFLLACNRCYPPHVGGIAMKEIGTPRGEALRKFLKLERTKAELTQAQLAERLGWLQKTISDIEIGTRRVSAIELIQLGDALDFDPAAAIRRIARIRD